MNFIYFFDPHDYRCTFEDRLVKIRETAGEEATKYAISHIKDESPTFDWLIKGMLGMADLDVNRVDREDGLTAFFLYTKIFRGNQIALKGSESMVCINSESGRSYRE
jgi:hypothetical protein